MGSLYKNTLVPIQYRDYDEVVSLGMCCEPTFLIRKLELSKQKKSYPLDWMACTTTEDMIRLCGNGFKGLSDLESREHRIHGTKLSPKDYDIVVPYHTPEQFRKKTDQKIHNWDIMCASSWNVLFLLKCHPIARCSGEQATRLLHTIHTVAPHITCHLAIINEYDISESQEPFSAYPSPKECSVIHMVGHVNPHIHGLWACDKLAKDIWAYFGPLS